MKFQEYIIRPLVPGDLLPYYAMVDRNRSRLGDFFAGTVSRTCTLQDSKAFLEDITELAKHLVYLPYLIIDEKHDVFSGFLDPKNTDWSIPKSEVGCYTISTMVQNELERKHWKYFVNICFSNFGFKKLFLRTNESNVAAQQVAKIVGFNGRVLYDAIIRHHRASWLTLFITDD